MSDLFARGTIAAARRAAGAFAAARRTACARAGAGLAALTARAFAFIVGSVHMAMVTNNK